MGKQWVSSKRMALLMGLGRILLFFYALHYRLLTQPSPGAWQMTETGVGGWVSSGAEWRLRRTGDVWTAATKLLQPVVDILPLATYRSGVARWLCFVLFDLGPSPRFTCWPAVSTVAWPVCVIFLGDLTFERQGPFLSHFCFHSMGL